MASSETTWGWVGLALGCCVALAGQAVEFEFAMRSSITQECTGEVNRTNTSTTTGESMSPARSEQKNAKIKKRSDSIIGLEAFFTAENPWYVLRTV